jgi:hypothetical protein
VSEVASPVVDIFQAKKNDTRSLARYRSRQLSRINAIARIQWNWYYSPKPEDRNGHVALLKTVSNWPAVRIATAMIARSRPSRRTKSSCAGPFMEPALLVCIVPGSAGGRKRREAACRLLEFRLEVNSCHLNRPLR